MSEETKFTEDELKQLEAVRKSYFEIQNKFGQLKLAKLRLEEQLKQLQSELSKKNPLETSEVANNPYSNINDIQGLQNKAKEVNQVIEWAEDVLFNADGYGPEDIVTTVEGKDLTKADVRKSLLNARSASNNLPQLFFKNPTNPFSAGFGFSLNLPINLCKKVVCFSSLSAAFFAARPSSIACSALRF